MRGLLANPDVRPLASRDARRAREYASDVFGGSIYAPWLVFYATYRGEFLEGWVPDNFFQGVAVMRINGKYHRIDDSRSLFARLLGADELPDVAHFVSGEWRDPAGAPLDRGALDKVLFQRGDTVCVKVDASSRGRGVSILTRETFDPAAVEQHGNLVVQSFIRQCAFFREIFPGAVATLRITTGKIPGAPARVPRLLSARRSRPGAGRQHDLAPSAGARLGRDARAGGVRRRLASSCNPSRDRLPLRRRTDSRLRARRRALSRPARTPARNSASSAGTSRSTTRARCRSWRSTPGTRASSSSR